MCPLYLDPPQAGPREKVAGVGAMRVFRFKPVPQDSRLLTSVVQKVTSRVTKGSGKADPGRGRARGLYIVQGHHSQPKGTLRAKARTE